MTRNAKNKGATIVEALVAMFIIVLVSVGILSGLVLSTQQGRDDRMRILATMVAESAMEDFKAHPLGTTAPPLGWKAPDSGTWTKEDRFELVVDGVKTTLKFDSECSLQSDKLELTVRWRDGEEKSLNFELGLEEHWATPPKRDRPDKIEESFRYPESPEYPTEPRNDHGEIHTHPPDDPGDFDEHIGNTVDDLNSKKKRREQLQEGIDSNNKQIAQNNETLKNSDLSDDDRARLEQQNEDLKEDNRKKQNEIDQINKELEPQGDD